MYVYMHIRVYIYVYIYTYICTYIYGRVEEGEVTTADNYERRRRRRKHVPVEEDVSKCERRSQSLRWSVSMTKKKRREKQSLH